MASFRRYVPTNIQAAPRVTAISSASFRAPSPSAPVGYIAGPVNAPVVTSPQLRPRRATAPAKDASVSSLLDKQQSRLQDLEARLRSMQIDPAARGNDKEGLAMYLDSVASKIDALDEELQVVANKFNEGAGSQKAAPKVAPPKRTTTGGSDSPVRTSWSRGTSPVLVPRLLCSPREMPRDVLRKEGTNVAGTLSTSVGALGEQFTTAGEEAQKLKTALMDIAVPCAPTVNANAAAGFVRQVPTPSGSFTPLMSTSYAVSSSLSTASTSLPQTPALSTREAREIKPQPRATALITSPRSQLVSSTSWHRLNDPAASQLVGSLSTAAPTLNKAQSLQQLNLVPQLSVVPPAQQLSGVPPVQQLSGVPGIPPPPSVPPPQQLVQQLSGVPPPQQLTAPTPLQPINKAALPQMRSATAALQKPIALSPPMPIQSPQGYLPQSPQQQREAAQQAFAKETSADNTQEPGIARQRRTSRKSQGRQNENQLSAIPESDQDRKRYGPGADPTLMGMAPKHAIEENPLSDSAVSLQHKLAKLAAHSRRVL